MQRLLEGVVVYHLLGADGGVEAGVLLTHHRADPLKRSRKWRAETAARS